MNCPSVSVIVPVYNVEPFVTQCLESLVGQSLDNMEILVVDDGSTDGTPDIIKSFANRYGSVRVFTQENHGLSAARNLGMSAAQGEFIGFVDGDDWVDERMFETLFAMAINCQADIVIGNGQLIDHLTGETKPIQDTHGWTSLKSQHEDLFLSPGKEPDLFMLDTSVCKRLFRREFLKSLCFRFPHGKIFEDVPTHYHMLLNTESVALVDQELYFYRTNRPGRITARTDETLLQVFEVMQQVIDDLNRYDANLTVWANYIWFQSWVLQWLRNQIIPEFAGEFDRMCYEISKNFKESSLKVFEEKFNANQRAMNFVTKQVNNRVRDIKRRKGAIPKKLASDSTLHLGNDPEGIFNADPNTFTPDIWGWICLRHDIRSVLDLGCGMGTNLSWFAEYGFDVLGVEGHPNAIATSLVPDKVIQHDFSKGPWSPERKFDLCICTEFAEHVEEEFEENWMVAVDKCNYLLLAAAPLGQGGYHHVNEQPDEYWIKKFESRGFVQDSEITSKLRDTCARKPATWGRNPLMFFHKDTNGGDSTNISHADHHAPESRHHKNTLPSNDLATLRLQNDVLKNRLANVYSSGSWKMTAPLRWILGMFRGK